VFGFGRSRKEPMQPSAIFQDVVGSNSSFEGDLKSDGNVRVDGFFRGSIESAGNVIIGEMGRVLADVTAQNVSVSGALKGRVVTTGRLEILPTGRVWGDVSVASLLIDEGGLFRGQSAMEGDYGPLLLDAPDEDEPPALEDASAGDEG